MLQYAGAWLSLTSRLVLLADDFDAGQSPIDERPHAVGEQATISDEPKHGLAVLVRRAVKPHERVAGQHDTHDTAPSGGQRGAHPMAFLEQLPGAL